MSIVISGDFLGASGYANHTRGLANALNKLMPGQIKVDCPRIPGWELQCSDEELKMLNGKPDRKDTNIFIGLPHYWPLALSQRYAHFIGFLVWEGTHIPISWINEILDDRVDQVWVPSRHVQQACINTYNLATARYGLSKEKAVKFLNKIKIVPHGFDPSIFVPQEKTETEFVFVTNKGWARGMQDRGGMQHVIKAYLEEFKKEEPVILKAKINPVYAPQGWNLDAELQKLGAKKKEGARMMIAANVWNRGDLAKAYDGDVFVCATMGEAFNLPGIEAMACGLPTIQTGFGGQTDYMTDDNSLKIDYEFVPATEQMYEGSSWAMPDVGHLRRLMRSCFENRDVVKSMSHNALRDAKSWTWDKSAEKAKAFLDQL